MGLGVNRKAHKGRRNFYTHIQEGIYMIDSLAGKGQKSKEGIKNDTWISSINNAIDCLHTKRGSTKERAENFPFVLRQWWQSLF